MKYLRIVFIDKYGQVNDVVCSMEIWIADWRFNGSICPSNDTVIVAAEKDGESILEKITPKGDKLTFLDIVQYLNWYAHCLEFRREIEGPITQKDLIHWLREKGRKNEL